MDVRIGGRSAAVAGLLIVGVGLGGGWTLRHGAERPQPEAFVAAGLTPMHRLLGELEGEYDVKIQVWSAPEAEPRAFAASARRWLSMGGRWIEEEIDATGDERPFIRRTLMGHNAAFPGGARFERVTFSSAADVPMPETGTYDSPTKTFTFSGTHEIEGFECRTRTNLRMESHFDQVMEVYVRFKGVSPENQGVDVGEFKAIEVRYVRRG
ncbi:MAG: DUF1579 family protein [Phycisphaeraceae bacterium]|nr:MAG: DUF1579 family protein [Phycisphaeraceae bacterium]